MSTSQSIEKLLLELLGEGEAMVSITHDRPPVGSWFIEVTDYWTGMITRQFSGSSLLSALKAAVDRKTEQEKPKETAQEENIEESLHDEEIIEEDERFHEEITSPEDTE